MKHFNTSRMTLPISVEHKGSVIGLNYDMNYMLWLSQLSVTKPNWRNMGNIRGLEIWEMCSEAVLMFCSQRSTTLPRQLTQQFIWICYLSIFTLLSSHWCRLPHFWHAESYLNKSAPLWTIFYPDTWTKLSVPFHWKKKNPQRSLK